MLGKSIELIPTHSWDTDFSIMSYNFPEDHVSAATGVVFSSSRFPESESSSLKSSPAGSIRNDSEKANVSLEDEDKALAYYLVPALEKGQKNARLKPSNPWIKFRVWYNPYRMVCQYSSIALKGFMLTCAG